jgi:hypothetical protein
MPTENRRIATYLPKEVDEKFKAFKLERGIKGDSHALLTVLSEFLGVNQEVAYSSSPDFLDRFESLEKIVSQLQQELNQLRSLPKLPGGKESGELIQQFFPVVPGQLSFLEPVIESSISVDLPGELISDSLSCLTGSKLSKRLKLTSKVLSDRRRKRTDEVFIEWSRKLDPDGIGWQYDSEKKAYFSVNKTSLDCQDF